MPDAPTDDLAIPLAAIEAVPAELDDGVSGRKGYGIGFWLGVAFLTVLTVLLVTAPWLGFLKDAGRPSADLSQTPNGNHWFGTDELGRDLFARVVFGGRASLSIGLVSLVLGFTIGGLIGLTAGFFRGTYERITMALVDVMLSIPSLILALALLAMLSEPGTQQGSFGKVVTVLTILSVPALARITRANTIVYSQREFVLAARALGAKPARILRKEILPNVLPAMLSFSFVALAILVVAEGALAFLGLSVEAPNVTWGKLIEAGRGDLDKAAYLSLFPCGALFLTLLSLNFVGDKLQARFAVKEAAL